MRIVFMGTPDFAVPSLKALLESPYEVVGVVCQPDKPKGRGKVLASPPIKVLALERGLPLLQPEKMRAPGVLETLKQWDPDLIAVTAFGRILPKEILNLPRFRCVNVHASLLPRYRGAAPIQWAIINGEEETGITIMLMDEGMDTGPILNQEKVPIFPEEVAGELSVRLAQIGGKLLVEAIQALEDGRLVARSQQEEEATLAPLLKKEEGNIDWTLKTMQVLNRIRGLSPWPGTYSYLNAERIAIWKARVSSTVKAEVQEMFQPGTIISVESEECVVRTGDGALAITEVQPANKKRMTISQFLMGRRLSPNMVFTREP